MQLSVDKDPQSYDVVVFGSGINGCAISAELASRNIKVLNIEKDDIASGTSSHSTCLIHGGLRYLEQYNFSMVRKSLDERQSLLELAPHLVHPLPIFLPNNKKIKRPFWLVRLGIKIYDNLSSKNKLPKSKYIEHNELNEEYFSPLNSSFKDGLTYYDCVTDDSRLTITKALQAQELGAKILQQAEITAATSENGIWHLDLQSKQYGQLKVKTKVIVNATGASVLLFAKNHFNVSLKNSIRLVKGSHIIIPKLYTGNHAYLLQNSDKRIIFVTPFHEHTMIGTTDVYQENDEIQAHISEEEINYLINSTNNYFKMPIDKKSIIATRCGLRVLLASQGRNASELSRDYALEFSKSPAPMLHIIGGKLTVHSQLAEQAVEKLREIFPSMPKTQRLALKLPGSSLDLFEKTKYKNINFNDYVNYANSKYHWLNKETLTRYLASYGTNTEKILAPCKNIESMGMEFAKTYYKVEIDYLIREEFASDLYSILWLHTKLGLIISEDYKQKLADYIKSILVPQLP